MQYVLNDPRRYITTIEFKNLTPILNIERLHSFREEGQVGTFLKKEFRYSFDNNIWQPWQSFTNSNLHSISFQDNVNFYIHIKYTRASVVSGNINAIYLNFDSGTTPLPSPDASNFDAATLQGEDGAFYLNRENHYGPYTGLNFRNVIDGSSVGVWYNTVDTSLDTTVYFKRIEGTGGAVITESSAGIISISVDASGIDPEYQNPAPTAVSVGGIPNASTFFATPKTFEETMQAMFYPTLYPALQDPGNSFSDNVANLQEIGTSINIQFTSSFSRGSINPQYTAASPYRSGLGNTVLYTGTGLVNVGSYPLSPNIQTVSGYVVLIGTQTWTSAWSYDVGVQPKDSVGNDYMSPWPAGTTGYQSTSFEGVYALYGTTSTISNPDTKQALVSMLTGNNVVFALVAQPTSSPAQSFDIPDAWTGAPTNRPLVGLEQFNTLTSTWDSILLSQWTTSSITHGGINYTRYTWNGDPIGARQIRLKF